MIQNILIALTASLLIFTASWFYSKKINNYSIVDVIWAYSFSAIALTLGLLSPSLSREGWIFIAMLSAWSFRLGSHLGRRVFSHLDVEDGRYLKLREEYGENVESRFFRFFMMQAVSVVFLLLPLFIVLNGAGEITTTAAQLDPSEIKLPHPIQMIGVLVWITGWLGESLADAQLAVFKRNPLNKGKVCEVGLWSYSRHPNYFFEAVIWLGFGIYTLSYPYGWFGLLAPVSMTYLLLKVTGVPYAEAQSLKSKGALYQDYQRRVNAFFPGRPKKPKHTLLTL